EARLALVARDPPHLGSGLDVDADERRLPLRTTREVGDDGVHLLRRPRDLDLLLDLHASATVASTSTGMPAGSSATPIALRAQRPRSSPYTSTTRSVKPLITAGWSPKPGAERTSPRTLTQRSTASSEPSSSRSRRST